MVKSAYDLVIIGSGVSGLSAGLFARRYGLETILLERLMTGGQIINADNIENYPGFPDGVSGATLSSLIQDHALKNGLEVHLDEVTSLKRSGNQWELISPESEYLAKAVIIAGGSALNKLGVPGEEQFLGSGVSYCATCDGAFFTGQKLAVVGSGDSAMDEARVLSEFASEALLFIKTHELTGQKILQERIMSNSKVTIITNTRIDNVFGTSQVEGITTTNTLTNEESKVGISGIFIYVGLKPHTDYLKDLLPLDNRGHIPTDLWMRTPVDGIFAIGDIRQNSASQLISGAGDGATAAIAASRYIENRNFTS